MTIYFIIAGLTFLCVTLYSENSKLEINNIKEKMNEITEEFLTENSINDIFFGKIDNNDGLPSNYKLLRDGNVIKLDGNSKYQILEKSLKVQSNYRFKPIFKEPIVVMLRNENLAIVDKYDSGHQLPLSGIIGMMNDKDMRWTWTLSGKSEPGKVSHHDIIKIIGSLE